MKDQISETQTNAILKALDDALANGPWDESNFLRVIGKNIQEIRDNLANEIEKNSKGSTRFSSKQDAYQPERSGQREVYIALYSSDGVHMQSWERILVNLPRQIISRPIYSDEEHVKTLIKSKENKLNEAYVVIYVNESDVLTVSPDKIPLDKFGKPLMALKDRSLNMENIIRFVHLSGVYSYSKGHLVKNTSPEA